MKNYGLSANALSVVQRADVQPAEQVDPGAGEHTADELATSLAMMHATLESTTDAILFTDEANYVREFGEKYVKLWGIPPRTMVSHLHGAPPPDDCSVLKVSLW